MAKYCGKIGFSKLVETKPGVWEEQIIERTYFGDMSRLSRRFQSSGNLNDNVTISNELSIVADPFANENFQSIRYVTYLGTKWKVSSVEVQYPRLNISLGEVWNG